MAHAKRTLCSSHSVALNAGNKALMWKVHFLPAEVEGHPEGIWGWEGKINKLCYFNSLPQVQTLFRFFTVWAPKTQISLSCQFLINVFLCLKTIKAACLGYFFGPFLFFFKLFYLFALGLTCSMWDLVPWLVIKPGPPTLGARSLSHWTTREVPLGSFLWGLRHKVKVCFVLFFSCSSVCINFISSARRTQEGLRGRFLPPWLYFCV